jgi:NarL family two-component system response regulator LiaR
MTMRGRVRFMSDHHLAVERLTDRELQVLTLVAAGQRNRQIAATLKVSIKTVEFHLSNILAKLNAQSRTEAVVRAWQTGMLRLQAS